MLSNPVRPGRAVSKPLRHQDRKKFQELTETEKPICQKRPVALFPHVGVVLRDNSPVFYQQASPGNHSAVIKVIIADDLEFCLTGAAHVAI